MEGSVSSMPEALESEMPHFTSQHYLLRGEQAQHEEIEVVHVGLLL
jgi:hypothetical protein